MIGQSTRPKKIDNSNRFQYAAARDCIDRRIEIKGPRP
jgi:hypothetical protein